jgi:hypothetical protein
MAETYRIEFDPEGYSWPEEPGLDWEIRGDQLASRKAGDGTPFLRPSDFFWNPPDSQWLLPKPRQFDPDWIHSINFPDSVARASKWSFTSGINPADDVVEVDIMASPSQVANEENEFMSFFNPADPGVPPIAIDFVSMATVAGVAIPASLQVTACTLQPQPGAKAPFLQWAEYPNNVPWAFGWGNLALIFYQGAIYVMQHAGGGLSNWARLGVIPADKPVTSTNRVTVYGDPVGPEAQQVNAEVKMRTLMALAVGFDDLYLGTGGGSWQSVPLRKSIPSDRYPAATFPIKPGRWWFALPPSRRFLGQFQAVNYSTGNRTQGAVMWDTAGDAPTTDPVLWTSHRLKLLDADDFTRTELTSGYRLESTFFGEQIEVQVLDDEGEAWDPGDGKSRGMLHLKLTPGNDPETAVVPEESFGFVNVTCPQLRLVQLRFPPKLTARVRPLPDGVTRATLEFANEFVRVNAESGLYSHDSKKVAFFLNTAGAAKFRLWGLHRRTNYPVHLIRDVDGDESIVIRAWVKEPQLKTVKIDVVDPNDPDSWIEMDAVQVVAVGLIGRFNNSPWPLIPNLVDPENEGQTAHTTLVEQVLKKAGYDVTDPEFVSIAEDDAPDDLRNLPGSPQSDPGTTGARERQNPYAPSDEEGMGRWIARIGRQWRGWLFWERLDGQMRYEPDRVQVQVIDGGGTLASNATLYGTRTAALGAGRPARQKWLVETNEHTEEPITNFVKVLGVSLVDSQPLPVVVQEDGGSIRDPLAHNFVGERLKPVTIDTALAIDEKSQRQIAILGVRRLSRQRTLRVLSWMLALWEIEPDPIENDSVLTPEGLGGDWHMIHVRTDLIGQTGGEPLWQTFATSELLPEN